MQRLEKKLDELRGGSIELFADRVIRQRTRCYRETLLAAFDEWLRATKFICLEVLLDAKPLDAEVVAGALIPSLAEKCIMLESLMVSFQRPLML